MKKLILTLSIAIASYSSSFAQWQDGTHIYNTNTGYVGIGTSAPQAKLNVVGPSSGGGRLKIQTLGAFAGTDEAKLDFQFYTDGVDSPQAQIKAVGTTSYTGDMVFSTMYNGTFPNALREVMRLQGTTGNVGIGTSSPSAFTNIFKNWGGGASGGTTVLRVEGQGVGDVAYPLATFVHGGNAPALHVMASGNVGVGTTIPYENLSVAGSSSSGSISLVPGITTYAGYKLVLNTQAADEGFNMTMGGTKIISAYGYNDADEVGFGNLGHQNLLYLNAGGNVGINTTDTKGYKFAVNGSAIAESVTVKSYGSWPDYVFKSKYKLPSLNDVKTYIDKNQRLPEMPSEQEVAKNGINLGEIVKIQTKKIEELTLYLIEQQKQIDELKALVTTNTKK